VCITFYLHVNINFDEYVKSPMVPIDNNIWYHDILLYTKQFKEIFEFVCLSDVATILLINNNIYNIKFVKFTN